MSFFKPTVNEAMDVFTKAEHKLHKALEAIHEDLEVQQQIINDATTKRRELTTEMVRASHFADKLSEFLR